MYTPALFQWGICPGVFVRAGGICPGGGYLSGLGVFTFNVLAKAINLHIE